MDQLDNQLTLHLQQQLPTHLNDYYPSNYQYYQTNNDESRSPPIVEHEQDENDQMPMPVVYKKRVRTKFSQEQLDVLEATFQQHRYPNVDIIDNLVEQLDLPTQKITIWFQNRRARLKKSQQKVDIQLSYEKEDQQQYDSGIHLDEDASRESLSSPPTNASVHLIPTPPPPVVPPFIPGPSPYYLPNSHYPFYNSMWPNFGYPLPPPSSFPPSMANSTTHPYNFIGYNSSEMPSSFLFQDISNYSHPKEFNGEL